MSLWVRAADPAEDFIQGGFATLSAEPAALTPAQMAVDALMTPLGERHDIWMRQGG